MAILDTVGRLVRLPLHVAGTAISTATRLLPGHGAKSAPTGATGTPPPPTDLKPVAEPAPAPAKGPVKTTDGPVPDPAAPAAPSEKAAEKKAPAKKAPAKKAPAKKAPPKKAAAAEPAATLPPPVPEPEPEPVTDIDKEALDDEVDVTPADIADKMGTQLDDKPADS